MPSYTSSPVSVYTMDPDTGYLTHQLMRTATSSLTPATRNLPLLGKDAPGVVDDIVLESGKIVYYIQLETVKTREDDELRKRASRRGKRAIRAMERMVQDLEDALLQDDDAPQAEKDDADNSLADESLVEEDSCEVDDSDDEEEEEHELNYFEDPDNVYIPTSPWLNGSSSSESLSSTDSSGSLFSSASTDSASSSQMDEEEEERVSHRIEEFVASSEARYPMTEDTYVLCFPALFRETPAPGVEAPTAASIAQEEPQELTTSTSDTCASAPPGLAVAVPPTHGVASASSPAHRRATVKNENATPVNTAVREDKSTSRIALAAAPVAVVAARPGRRDGVASAASSTPCGATANAQPFGAIESNLQARIPRKDEPRTSKRKADDDDDNNNSNNHREEASEAASNRVSLPKFKKFKASHDVDASATPVAPATRKSTKVEPEPQGKGKSRAPPPPLFTTPLPRPLSTTSAPARAERRLVQKRKRTEEDDDKEDGELSECEERSRPAPAAKKFKRTPASTENLCRDPRPTHARAPVPTRPALAHARAYPPPARPTQARAGPSSHPFDFSYGRPRDARRERQVRKVSTDALAMPALKAGLTRVAKCSA
ncbi:hypothetical protein C8Q80DRAFT_1266238 [Daedaleopsis nitida]|nr:hypothetical protein C8Q80DRAFT_1266238 [Daedaleopsis nitida]